MASIAEYLRKILSARKGEEVRGSIHDSIKAMNDQIENDLGGMIEDGNEVIEAMQEEIQSVETMKENGDLNMKPEDLTEAQWENLKTDLTNYYKRYESVYTTTQENEINIPINISQYNTLAILEVYIEGRMLNRNEYAINGTNSITLNIPLSEIGTKVHFIVYRSVCASNEDLNELKGPKGDSGAIVFDTIAEMKADEDLVAGDTCQTLGYNSKNDGNRALYNIVDDDSLTPDDYNIIELDNELKAVKISNSKIDFSYIIDEIEHFELYHENSKSTVQIFHIPHRDKFNKTINIKHGFANDIISNTIANEKPSEFSYRKSASLCINASIFDVDTSSPNYNRILGLIIHNGEIVTDTRQYYGGVNWWKDRYILGLKNDGLLKSYIGNIQAEDLIDDGVIESWTGFIPLIVNGESYRSLLEDINAWPEPHYQLTSDITPLPNKIYYILDNGEYKGQYNIQTFNNNYQYYEQINGNRYPRQIIAQNETTKDFYILSANGKGKTENLGLTLEEVITFLKYVDDGITFAYKLDEGGSTASIYKNINNILPSDGQTIYSKETSGIGVNERKVPDFIYFSKEVETEKDKQINYMLCEIELLKKEVRRLKLTNDLNDTARTNSGLNIQNYNIAGVNSLLIKFSQLLSDGTLKDINALVSNPQNEPGSLNFYDIENSRTVLRAKNDGTILVNENGVGLEEIANIFKNVKESSNFNNERKTGIKYGYGSTTGAPFSGDTRVQFVLTLHTNIQGGLTSQIGFFVGQVPTQIAYRCILQNNAPTQWKYINFDS